MQKKLTITIDEKVYEGFTTSLAGGRSAVLSSLWSARTSLARTWIGYREMAGMKHEKPKPWHGPTPRWGISPMKRGEVWWVAFPSTRRRGPEASPGGDREQ